MSEAHDVVSYDKPVSPEPVVSRLEGRAEPIKSSTGGTLLPFAKGVSGNPGGRTKAFTEMQRMARDASPVGISRLIEMMHSDDERVAIIATNSVLDRAWGKPKEQKVEDNQAVKPDFSSLSPAGLAGLRLAMAELAKAAALTDSTQDVAPSVNASGASTSE